MSKHRWRESLKCLCENHIDPEIDEQLKQSKIEIQAKVSKALKPVNDRRHNRKNRNGEGNSRRESEFSQLVEDFSRQYQFIYDLHVNLRKQLAQTYEDITEEGFYTASSDSASETSEDSYYPNGGLEHEDLKWKLTLLSQEKESLNSKHTESLSKIEELEKIVQLLDDESKQLKEKLGGNEGQLSELAGAHEARNKEALVLIKDLEARVEKLNHEKGRLQEQTENELKVIKQMQMKESDLKARVLSLEKATEDKEDELSALRPKVKGLESDLNAVESKLKQLEEQLTRKDEENGCLKDEVDGLLGKVSQLENKVEEYGNDNKCAQMEELKKEINQLNSGKEFLQVRILELEKQLQEKGDRFSNMSMQMEVLPREVNQVQQEVDVKRRNKMKNLLEEKEALERKVSELEIRLTEREDKVAKLLRQVFLAENESSASIGLLNNQMSSLQQQMTSERDKSLEKLSLVEKQNTELTNKISDQQMILKQQDDTINSLRGDCKLAKSRLLQAADRKIEEMAEEFRKSFEANIMILRQRIRVAEQVQAENKESFKSIKDRCEQEHLGLEKKVQEYSQMIATSKREICNFFEATNEMINGLQSLSDRFGDREGEFSWRISRVLDEITVMKNWIKVTATEMKPVEDECTIDKHKEDRARLLRGIYELQKKVVELEKGAAEKDEQVLKLGEEKKEAIRQLCMHVEYHRNRCDQVITLLAKSRRR